jgi:hypothetical protein
LNGSYAKQRQEVLKAFLKAYPKGALADQVRDRLRAREHRWMFGLLLIGFLVGLAQIGGVTLWRNQSQYALVSRADQLGFVPKLNTEVTDDSAAISSDWY